VPVARHGELEEDSLICKPDRGRLWWLRVAASTALRIAMP